MNDSISLSPRFALPLQQQLPDNPKYLIMKKILISLLMLLSCWSAQAADELTVLQWNVWQEGTSVKGGYDAIVNEIVRLKPDFVTLSEVRNYHNTNFTARLCASLRERGEMYYSFYSYDTGLLSRYPITDSLTVFPCRDDHGSIYRLLCEGKGRKWAVYTAHLDYLNDTYYEVRGYDGCNWHPMTPLTDVQEILRRNALSKREEATRIFLAQAEKDKAAGYNIILGGDFNEPSFLDWTERTRFMYDHHGTVVPWPVSVMLHEAGFKDAWRVKWPNELTHPGFTFPADNPDVSPSRLSWTPLGDERDRIDYVHYLGEGMEVADARIFGPEGSIVYGKRRPNPTHEPFITPLGTWPTDHKGVWVKFRLR